MSNRESWVNQLRTNICEVTFTKVNGDTRVMTCTLREDLVPQVATQADAQADDTGVQRTLDVVRVWDTTALGWRSFRVDNVSNFSVVS